MPKPTTTAAFALALLLACLSSAGYADSPAGVIGTPDGNAELISKDVGHERWAITLSLRDDDAFTITGNVFRTDGGPPAFVACFLTNISGTAEDLAHATFHYECFGNEACHVPGACPPWSFIAGDVTLPGSFFIPK